MFSQCSCTPLIWPLVSPASVQTLFLPSSPTSISAPWTSHVRNKPLSPDCPLWFLQRRLGRRSSRTCLSADPNPITASKLSSHVNSASSATTLDTAALGSIPAAFRALTAAFSSKRFRRFSHSCPRCPLVFSLHGRGMDFKPPVLLVLSLASSHDARTNRGLGSVVTTALYVLPLPSRPLPLSFLLSEFISTRTCRRKATAGGDRQCAMDHDFVQSHPKLSTTRRQPTVVGRPRRSRPS